MCQDAYDMYHETRKAFITDKNCRKMKIHRLIDKCHDAFEFHIFHISKYFHKIYRNKCGSNVRREYHIYNIIYIKILLEKLGGFTRQNGSPPANFVKYILINCIYNTISKRD